MERDEAMEIIKLYRNWNTGNTSVSLAFNGIRTSEDDVLDARRAALKKAHEVLSADAAGEKP